MRQQSNRVRLGDLVIYGNSRHQRELYTFIVICACAMRYKIGRLIDLLSRGSSEIIYIFLISDTISVDLAIVPEAY